MTPSSSRGELWHLLTISCYVTLILSIPASRGKRHFLGFPGASIDQQIIRRFIGSLCSVTVQDHIRRYSTINIIHIGQKDE